MTHQTPSLGKYWKLFPATLKLGITYFSRQSIFPWKRYTLKMTKSIKHEFFANEMWYEKANTNSLNHNDGLNVLFPFLFVGLLSWNNVLFQASARDCANLTCVTQASPSGVPSNKLASVWTAVLNECIVTLKCRWKITCWFNIYNLTLYFSRIHIWSLAYCVICAICAFNSA